MTDFHCRRCRKRVTIYTQQTNLYCDCGTRMRLGRGRRTRYDPWASLWIDGGHKPMHARQVIGLTPKDLERLRS